MLFLLRMSRRKRNITNNQKPITQNQEFCIIVRIVVLLFFIDDNEGQQKYYCQNCQNCRYIVFLLMSENSTQEQEAQLGQEAKEYVLCLPMPWERKET